MRHASFFGLTFLVSFVLGCADKPAPQETVGQVGPIDSAIGDTPLLPEVPTDADQPLTQVAPGDEQPIPQDLAKIENRLREELEWNRRTLQGAYEKVGEKDPKWDKSACDALDLAARMFALQIDPIISYTDVANSAKVAIDAGCNDPLITYFYVRVQAQSNDIETQRF